MGQQKLLMSFRGRPLIEHAIAAAARWNPVIVAGVEVGAYLAGRSDITLVRNDEPELGMSHSLELANRYVRYDIPIVVLLADKPLVGEPLIEAICNAAPEADVVYPVRGTEPGHPVRLSPRARACIEGLPRGDTLRLLRSDDRLISHAVVTQDEGATFDIDTLAAFEE